MSERTCPCGFDAAKFEPRPEKVDGAWRWHQAVCAVWQEANEQRASCSGCGGFICPECGYCASSAACPDWHGEGRS